MEVVQQLPLRARRSRVQKVVGPVLRVDWVTVHLTSQTKVTDVVHPTLLNLSELKKFVPVKDTFGSIKQLKMTFYDLRQIMLSRTRIWFVTSLFVPLCLTITVPRYSRD